MLRNIELDYVQPYQLGELGENIFKKLFKSKALRKVGAVAAGIVSLGIIKAKALGIKNPKSLKYFKVGKIVGIAGAVVTGAFFAGPSIAGFMKAAGSKVYGILTETFTAKGLSSQAAGLAAKKVMSGSAPVPPEAVPQLEQMALQYDQTIRPPQAGMFGFGGGEISWGTIAIGVVAIGAILFMTSGQKTQYARVGKIRKNPGAMWHKLRAEAAEDDFNRTGKLYYAGRASAHYSSEIAARNLRLNPKYRRK